MQFSLLLPMLAKLRCVFAFMSLIKLCCTHPILDLHVHLHLHLPRLGRGRGEGGEGGGKRKRRVSLGLNAVFPE